MRHGLVGADFDDILSHISSFKRCDQLSAISSQLKKFCG